MNIYRVTYSVVDQDGGEVGSGEAIVRADNKAAAAEIAEWDTENKLDGNFYFDPNSVEVELIEPEIQEKVIDNDIKLDLRIVNAYE